MPSRINVVVENGLVLAHMPYSWAWNVIDRLRQLGVQPFFSIRGDQFNIYFADGTDRETAQRQMDLCLEPLPAPSEVDDHRENQTHFPASPGRYVYAAAASHQD